MQMLYRTILFIHVQNVVSMMVVVFTLTMHDEMIQLTNTLRD